MELQATFKPVDETLKSVGIEIPGLAQIVGHLQFHYYPTKSVNIRLQQVSGGDYNTTDTSYTKP